MPGRRKSNDHLPVHKYPAIPLERQNNGRFREAAMKHPALAMFKDKGAQKWRAYFDKRRAVRPKIPLVEEPNVLIAAFGAYVEFQERNPYIRSRPASDGTFHEVVRLPVTLAGFLAYTGIGRQSWTNWITPTSVHYREDLAPAMNHIMETMRQAGIQQAASRELDPNFMARVLQLGDKIDTGSGQSGLSAAEGQSILDKIRARISGGPAQEDTAE